MSFSMDRGRGTSNPYPVKYIKGNEKKTIERGKKKKGIREVSWEEVGKRLIVERN